MSRWKWSLEWCNGRNCKKLEGQTHSDPLLLYHFLVLSVPHFIASSFYQFLTEHCKHRNIKYYPSVPMPRNGQHAKIELICSSAQTRAVVLRSNTLRVREASLFSLIFTFTSSWNFASNVYWTFMNGNTCSLLGFWAKIEGISECRTSSRIAERQKNGCFILTYWILHKSPTQSFERGPFTILRTSNL